MGRTIHRKPLQVSTDVDVEQHYFTHSNWKGICDDKNYLNVDQETFEDCLNVYMDSEGLLKSRPNIRNDNLGRYVNKIADRWTFSANNGEKLTFYLNENKDAGVLTYEILFKNSVIYRTSNEKPRLLQKENIIFLFSVGDILYFNYETSLFERADDFIYKPIVKTYHNDIESELEAESENLITNIKKEVRSYDSFDNINAFLIPSDNVKLKISDDTYNISLKENSNKTFVNKIFKLNALNYADEYTYGPYGKGRPLLFISDKNTAILCERVEGNVLSYNIYYTSDFLTWKFIDNVTDAMIPPQISLDGSVVYYPSGKSIMIKSLLDDSYLNWTKFLELPLLTNPDEGYNVYNRNISLGIVMYTDKTIACAYGCEVDGVDENYYDAYRKLILLKYTDDGTGTSMPNYEENSWNVYNTPIALSSRNVNDDDWKIDCLFGRFGVINGVKTFSGCTYASDEGYVQIIDAYSSQIEFSRKIAPMSRGFSYNRTIDKSVFGSLFFEHDVNENTLKLRKGGIGYALDLGIIIPNIQRVEPGVNILIFSNNTKEFVIGNSLNQYGSSYLDMSENTVKLLHENVIPLHFKNGTYYYISHDYLYVNKYEGRTEIEYEIGEGLNPILFDHNCELNEEYLSKGNELFISRNVYDEEGDFKLYFPKENNEIFNKHITNVHPVSQNQVAIFFDDEIWYVEKTELGYVYYKSKLQVGLKEGSDVLTSPDGKNIIFSSSRGLVYMSYQELVQSTEQTLTYLSDTIYERYKKYCIGPVKLFLHDFWLFCYRPGQPLFYVFDTRNSSWWKWEYEHPLLKLYKNNDYSIGILLNKDEENLRRMDINNFPQDLYKDEIDNNYFKNIDWYIVSQKLHLSTLNYSKNIVSIIINNVENYEVDEPTTFNLFIKNYRTKVSNRYEEPQNIEYKVDMLRTFVKRCNSRKVNEFQYYITNDAENAKTIPLSIHSIVIKYTISGQVR